MARPLNELTIRDVINAIDPLERIERCPLGLTEHGNHLGSLHRRLDQGIAELEAPFRRHAITAGFITLMIMGMAAKVVPTLNGIDPRTLSSLRGPFLLVNLGCVLRVTMQIATDWTDAAYAPIGFSGMLEVAGLAWWGLGLVALMRQGRLAALEMAPSIAPARIEANHRVAEVLEWFPQTEEVFLRHGFTALKNAALRRTLARQVTLAQAATLRGISLQSLLNDLNDVACGPIIELPILSLDAYTCTKGSQT